MSDGTAGVSRRGFLRASAGASAVAASAGHAAAQEEGGESGGSGGKPAYGGWFDNVDNFSSTVDETGKDEVTVEVGVDGNGGAFGFGPAAVHVDAGTTVVWEWTGEGGGHNVVSDGDGPLDSGSTQTAGGTTYEYTFEEDGIYKYYCAPHEGLGMKGAVVVGSDFEKAAPEGGDDHGGGPTLPSSAKTIGIATTFAMTSTLGLAYFFLKYGGDYEQPGK
jgi:halocyanin-like protein